MLGLAIGDQLRPFIQNIAKPERENHRYSRHIRDPHMLLR